MSNKNGKRSIDGETGAEQGSSKKAKPHAFFSNFAARKEEAHLPPTQRATVRVEAPPTVEHYLHLDPFASSGSSIGSPAVSTKVKVAMYDLDGTLIQPKSGARFPKDATDWKWWDATVKAKLAQVQKEQFHLVIISNQNLKEKPLKAWKSKVALICADLPEGMPIRILAATAKDQYRKPGIGLYELLHDLYEAKGLEIDVENSFYVGDAAGRAGDHNDTDRKFAVNAGLTFYTPEQYFKDSKKDPGFLPFKGFDATAELAAMDNSPLITPTSTPLIPASTKEIVIFVGYPASGKTSFYNKYFKPHGYIHLAKHNNFYRAYVAPNVPASEKRSILPETAFIGFKNALQEPDETEGFDEIRRVNFKFQGTEEDRQLWSRWMS
ncbi:hypothetical protein QFC22_003606 [Naganishia vaughanmartiniae]|uniref:Uncharacterized protein n=1 Tax=Naganishia vaughanmartiniae TaxID=1424756 RepID=A0ACC2X6V6_9TREE|nr:hypothetical protein QFC22_003606 [Naganishia vaughanmartiniae]